MKRYKIINNSLGWLCFVIAAVTYLLTLEPTASFWDCPEFIAQGTKLEVGHPPGNPIFMLTARFFVTIFGGSVSNAALAINTMSALLSAATILLLFWTITHLVRRVMVSDGAKTISWPTIAIIMSAGMCGALMYTWSDTFWFSAVESEVYAYSSFCTALVFWLILKWEDCADSPHSDRYLVLIAYVIGISIAVHLLNLLCIPAIVLVFYYRKWKNSTLKGSLLALGVSVVLVAAILYGLVPGFIKVAQFFELLFVNNFHLGYNTGVIAYAVILCAIFAAAIAVCYKGTNYIAMKILAYAVLVFSGLAFVTSSALVWVLLLIGFLVGLILLPRVPVRIFNVAILSIFFIFVGYSSYALLLIRASANTPMNQNAPDNVFSLSSYLNREQYGQRPLFYGNVFAEEPAYLMDDDGNFYLQTDPQTGLPYADNISMEDAIYYDSNRQVMAKRKSEYVKKAKTDASQPDEYVKIDGASDYKYSPDLCVPFTRIYSLEPSHIEGYKAWSGYVNPDLDAIEKKAPMAKRQEWAQERTLFIDGKPVDVSVAPLYEVSPYIQNLKEIERVKDNNAYNIRVWKPSYIDNLNYFFNYQLNHMYWRYFMWNFSGRQNDYQGNGEPNLGNWITGINALDALRLGDQKYLPDVYGKDNKGHNKFYMIPLLMGLIGIIWQALMRHKGNSQRGIEQFWVVFFLFFMTGIAIVLYLNQTPGQPRERDYAFAGSFYAFAIWVGMGVPALLRLLTIGSKVPESKEDDDDCSEVDMHCDSAVQKYGFVGLASLVGLLVPLQVVSQTWDDHDRSHRYTTRDFGANYLHSLDPNAIIFTNGDNDTFPLWYSQEVEGVRTDVRVVNLSYLSTDWYANQLKHPFYDAAAVPMTAQPEDYAYGKLNYSTSGAAYGIASDEPTEAIDALIKFYDSGTGVMMTPNIYSKVDKGAAAAVFGVSPTDTMAFNSITNIEMPALKGSFALNKLLSFDIVANSIYDNFERPVYFATTVPSSYYLGLMPYMYSTGVAYQVTPFFNASASPVAEKAYQNIMENFRWGGLDDPKHNKGLYLDETVRRMGTTMRVVVAGIAEDLMAKGDEPATDFAIAWAQENGKPVPATKLDMARQLMELLKEKMPSDVLPYESRIDMSLISDYLQMYWLSDNPQDLQEAIAVIDDAMPRYAQLVRYAQSLSPSRQRALDSGDRYARHYLPTLIGYKLLATRLGDIQDIYDSHIQELDAENNDDEYAYSDLIALQRMLEFSDALSPMLKVTRMNLTPEQFLQKSYEYSMMDDIETATDFYYAYILSKIFRNIGVNPYDETGKMLIEYGLDPSQI